MTLVIFIIHLANLYKNATYKSLCPKHKHSMSEIIAFFQGAPNRNGLTVHDIHEFDRDQLETKHDFIQWLFPTKSPSAFNPDVPSLTNKDIARFKRHRAYRKVLLANLNLMLAFYGFGAGPDGIEKASNFRFATSQWVTPHNHNYMRISRILDSLVTLHCRRQAISLYRALVHNLGGEPLLSSAFRHWRAKLGSFA